MRLRDFCLLALLTAWALPADLLAQSGDTPPTIQRSSIRWEISRFNSNGGNDPWVDFDPASETTFELDRLRVSFAVLDPDFYDQESTGDDITASDQLFYLFQNFSPQFSQPPNAPPIREDQRAFQPEEGDGLAPPPVELTFYFGNANGAPRSDYPPLQFTIPEFNGKNQDRAVLGYDVRYTFFCYVSNTQMPCDFDANRGFVTGCDEPVDVFSATITVLENPLLPPSNPPAFADAGGDQLVAVNTPVTLDGSRTFDSFNVGFDTGSDNIFEKDTLTFAWEWTSGPEQVEAVQTSQTSPTATVEFATAGTYTFRLTVSDNFNALPSTDSVTITVLNELPPENPPIATIRGPANAVFVGDTVTLDGTESNDPDGDTLSFRWLQTDQLGRELATEDVLTDFQPLAGANTSKVTWKTVSPGTYYFRLLVGDGVFQSTARFTVTVEEVATAGIVLTASDNNSGTTDATADAGDSAGGSSALAPLCGAGMLPLGLAPLVLLFRRRRA